MIHSQTSYASVLAAIAIRNPRTGETLTRLTTCAPRPQDGAGLGRACRGSLAAVRGVVSMIGAPSARLEEIETNLSALDRVIAQELQASGTQELASPIVTRTSQYPQWSALAALAQPDMPIGARLAAGVELLRAWKDARKISRAAAADLARAIMDDPLSTNELRLLLEGVVPTDDITSSWQKRLQRSWRQVVLHFGEVGSTPPPQNFEDRAQGQILESSVYASPTRRAGVSDHRQLSKLQMKDTFEAVKNWIDGDDFRGAYGCLVCITGFTVDLVPLIPLQSPLTQSDWIVVLDVEAGCLKMDVSALAHEAARPSMATSIMSNFVCIKPLPRKLAEMLRARRAQYPNARCLGDLYAGATTLEAQSSVLQCHDEIKPSWARLRRSTGTFMRSLGTDNLLVCMLSGDFGHIPRSKLYYACVPPQELFEAAAGFYNAAGWGVPAPMPADALAFGCRVVPTHEQIRRIDQWWMQATCSVAPGKHCALAQVLEHHNRFMTLAGFRLAVLFAMREQHQYCLNADVDERIDRWLPVDDKQVPGASGALPVPLTPFAAQTLSAVRAHCSALLARLQKLNLQHSELAKWCDKVVRRQCVPLLMLASAPSRLISLGTNDCIGLLPDKLAIAPDFGRKVMENALRGKGLRTGDIDAVLRHSVLGQSKASSVSDFTLLEWLARVTPVMDGIATELFGNVYFGLARE